MKPKIIKLLGLICVLGLLFSATPLRAQVAGATLLGTVTDAQGGVIAGAKVSARNAATGVTTDTTSNTSGAYSIVNLIPGNYDVSVSATGFSTTVSKVTLTVGAQQQMNIKLTVGAVSQTVVVTGEAPVIEMTNATLSGNIQSTQIVELPLNGRDWASLATLEPGVASVRPHEQVTQPGGNLRGLGNQMTIDGNRPTQNVYRLNGVIVNDYSNAGPGNVLGASVGVDAIQEFSVLTSNYSAQYGFTSGGVINAITKSGTNTFHGSVYEFIRNAALDSSDYLSGDKKPSFTRNQFGASGGWKILKDKAFLFGDYEGLRQSKGIPGSAKVLTQNARNGILNDKNGNPLSALSGACPFLNMTNHAPGQAAVCVDNFTYSFINALDPLPNGALIGPDNNAGRYNFAGAQGVTDNYFTIRGDVKISGTDSLAASYYRDHSTWTKPGPLNDRTLGYVLPNQSASLEETHIFGSAMVNSFRLGYTQSVVTNPNIAAINQALLDTQFGMTSDFSAPGLAGQGGGGAGVPGITGFGGYNPSGAGFSDWVQNFQVFDDATRTIGNHNVKFGFMFLRNHTDLRNANGNGSAGFDSLESFLQNEPITVRLPTSPPFTAGNTKHYNRNSVFGVYIQDDWKMRSNLTLNLGLRYEMATIPYEVDGKFILLPTLWSNPGNCSEDAAGLPQSNCSGLRHSVFDSNPTLRNFEPRVGFAWDPFKTGKTSIRGGFGIFDVLPMPFMFGLNALQSSPSGAEIDLTNATTCGVVTTPSTGCPLTQGSFTKGFPALAAGISPAGTGRWQYTDPNPSRNYVMQWNANFQRQITPDTSVTVAYAGSRALHNPFQTDTLNTCFPTSTQAGWLFPNPIGSCVFNTNPTGIVPGQMVNPFVPGLMLSTVFMGQSWYRSFQAKFDKRMSHGLQVETSFTWQRSMDTSSGSFAGDNYSSNPTAATPWWDLNIVKGLSDFNVSRNLTINWLWQIPTPASFAGPAGWVARGWQVGGLLSLSDGIPIWPLTGLGSDPLGQLNSEPMSIPDLAAGCTPENVVQPGNTQYLRPECFINPLAPDTAFATANCDQNPPLGKDGAKVSLASLGVDPLTCFNLLGKLPRNSIIGPGLFNVDMSFIKDNHIARISEAFNIQFRAEFFNILNHTNFAPPSNNLVALDPGPQDGFGVIDTPTQVPMREIQFALKIIW